MTRRLKARSQFEPLTAPGPDFATPDYSATVLPGDRRDLYGIAAWSLLTLLTLIVLFGHWGYDDPYITFRYASNLLAGHGFVYNVGERVLSTTAPFYATILAALGLIWSDLPLVANFLSALTMVASSLLLLALAWNQGQKAVGVLAAVLLSLSPYMVQTFGAETCVYVMLILAGFCAYDRSHLSVAAGALALAAMVRPDGVLAFIALGIYHLLRYRSVRWQPLILYGALVGAWYGGLWLYFGTPIPVTLLTKQQQGEMAISTRFAAGFLADVRQRVQQPLYWLPFALTVLGLVPVWKRARYWAPLLIWTVLYFAAYSILRVSQYFWYYTPLVPAAVVVLAEGAVASVRWLRQKGTPKPLVVSATGLLVLALLAPSLKAVIWFASHTDPRLAVYRNIGRWLASNTPPTSNVGALEVGIIGYYARRPMIDFAGLVQPDVALRFTPTYTYQDSAAWAVENYRPDYVILQRDAFSSLIQTPSFQDGYLPVQDFTNGGSLWLTLYRRDSSP